MGKNSWIALLLALVLLATTVPACAFGVESLSLEAYSEDDYGGLAPGPVRPPKNSGRPAGEGDNGGIAPDPVRTPSSSGQPAGEGDNGGIAPTPGQSSGTPGRPAGDGDNGGVAPSQPLSKRKNIIVGTVTAGISLSTDSHIAYAQGSGGLFPSFNPTRQVTRAEAAQMLYRLLPETPASSGLIT